MIIKSVSEPDFIRVKYNLNGLSWLKKAKFIWDTPPRLKLKSDFIIELVDGTKIIIPKGFVTDGASVPRWLWCIPGFSPFGVLLEGGIPHDLSYQYGYLLANFNPDSHYDLKSLELKQIYFDLIRDDLIPIFIDAPKEFFDNFFKEICIFSTGAKMIPKIAKFALWKFGYIAWNKYRTNGPEAFGKNSLGYPGINKNGVTF